MNRSGKKIEEEEIYLRGIKNILRGLFSFSVNVSAILKKSCLSNTGLFLLFFVAIVLSLGKRLSYPPYGDDLYVVWNSSYRILQGEYKGVDYNCLQNNDPGHPYLFYGITALGWKVLGVNPYWPHFLTVCLAALSLLYTVKIGRYLWGWDVGITAAILLFCNSAFISSAGLMHLNIPSLAMYLPSFYYFMRHKKIHFIISLAALTLFKATGIVYAFGLYAAFVVFIILTAKRHPSPGKSFLIGSTLFASAPLAFILFALLRKALTGNYISSPSYGIGKQMLFPSTWEVFMSHLKTMVWDKLFLTSELFLVVSFTILMAVYHWLRLRSVKTKQVGAPTELPGEEMRRRFFWLAAFLPVCVVCLFFGLRMENNLVTYYLPLFPFFYLGFTGYLLRTFKKSFVFVSYGIILILCLLLIVRWKSISNIGKWAGWCPRLDRYLKVTCSTNFGYIDPARCLLQAAQFVEEKYPDAMICATYPESHAFDWPWAGYVKKPYKTFEVYYRDSVRDFDRYYKMHKTMTTLIVTSGFSWQINMSDIVKYFKAVKLKEFKTKNFRTPITVWIVYPESPPSKNQERLAQ